MTLTCRRGLRLPLRTDFVQAVISGFFCFWVWAAANPSGTVITTGPTVTAAAWAAHVSRNCAARIVTSSASRRVLLERGADPPQDSLHAFSSTRHILRPQPPEQSLVQAHVRLQALALVC